MARKSKAAVQVRRIGIQITGVWLIRRGGESNPNATIEVHVQVDGLWRHVITEPISANFSHEVSATGIKNSPLSNWSASAAK